MSRRGNTDEKGNSLARCWEQLSECETKMIDEEVKLPGEMLESAREISWMKKVNEVLPGS